MGGMSMTKIHFHTPKQTVVTSAERLRRLEQRLAELGLPRRLDTPQDVDDAVSDLLACGYVALVDDRNAIMERSR